MARKECESSVPEKYIDSAWASRLEYRIQGNNWTYTCRYEKEVEEK